MIKIKISFLSLLADIVNEKEIILSIKEDSRIKNVLELLSRKFGNIRETMFNSAETLNSYIILGLNGKNVHSLDNLNTILHNGDEISFLPAIAGG
jgi:MoaD family protein